VYTPRYFAENDPEELLRIVREFSFATLITAGAELSITHVPLIYRGTSHSLVGHLAKANPHWKQFDGEATSVAVFTGPHAYISPSWYVNQPSVPTWNYAAVHVHGRPSIVEDAYESLLEMVAFYDPDLAESSPGSMSDEFVRSRVPAVVAFEMPIERIEGKFKLSQNRQPEDKQSVIQHLSESAPDVAKMMRERLDQ
jgi:transcriptional regulator